MVLWLRHFDKTVFVRLSEFSVSTIGVFGGMLKESAKRGSVA